MTSDPIEDHPTGAPHEPRPEHGKDAPDLPPDEAEGTARRNVVDEGGAEGAPADRDDPARHAPASDVGATAAGAIIPALAADGRIEKGSDPGSPLAGLLAAGAALPGPVDEGAYRAFLESHPGQGWAAPDDLAEQYGSFAAALAAAGIGN